MIKDLDMADRPREQLLKVGAENMSNTDLIAIILRTGIKGQSVQNLSAIILKKVHNLQGLKDINKEQILSIKGLGAGKAAQLLAAIELGKRIYLKKEDRVKEIYNNSLTIYEKNKYLFDGKKQECFYCLYLNTKKEMIERKLLFMGTLNKSCVHPREIFKEAYLMSASAIICMHNHPSGDVLPSEEDIILTESLMEIGKLQQIPVLDHIIFGADKYYSFYENDILSR